MRAVARVADIAEQVRGVSYDKQDATSTPRPGFLPILRAGNITDDGLVFDDLVFVPADRIADKQKIRRNDVIIAASSGSLDVVGKAARALDNYDGGFGAFCKVLRPGPDVEPSYFAHFFRTPDYRRRVSALAAGVNINNLRNEHLDQMLIPLPALPEQRRIAEILDKADALRAKRRAALAQLDILTQSIFLDMFGDPATNPKGWPIDLIGDVAEIVSGATPRTDNPKYWDGTIRWVTPKELSDLEDIYIAETERHITEAGLQSCAATVLPPGSVLFSSRAPIGHTAICATPMATNQGFKSFIPKRDRLDAHYLLAWLRLRRRFLEGLGTGATFKEVSKAVVARIQIPVPPLALQVAFANRMRKVQALREAERNAMALLDEQFLGLQYRAFSGEL
jgi:type I restriction enzyme S subunit